MTKARLSWLAPSYLFLCLLLGGSSQGIWSNAFLQLAGVGIISLTIWQCSEVHWRPYRTLWQLIFAFIILHFSQLIPLPPEWWAALPGREIVASGDGLLGFNDIWRPVSLSPIDGWDTLPTLIPPIAMFVACLVLNGRSGERITMALIGAVTLGLTLGALQVSANDARFYPYAVSNVGVPTGFFANGNHMAALLLCLLPFAAALVENGGTDESERQKRWVTIGLAAGLAFVAMAGLLFNRSLFGLAMLIPVGLASLLVALRHRIGRPRRLMAAMLALGMAILAVAASVMVIGQGRSAEAGVSLTSRAEMAAASWQLFTANLPLGTGIGTFERIYVTVEDPAGVDQVFVNHAHNDYLEWAVEGGLPGLVLLALFLAWWGREAVAMLRDRRADGFAQAGAIAGVVLLIHSAVDFPLRTAALATLFAAATGLMVGSRRLPKARPELRPARHLRID